MHLFAMVALINIGIHMPHTAFSSEFLVLHVRCLCVPAIIITRSGNTNLRMSFCMFVQIDWKYTGSEEDLAGCATAFLGEECAMKAITLLEGLESDYGRPSQLPNPSIRLKMRKDQSWVHHCFSCGMHNHIAWVEVRC